jgi:16S rRNA (cytosine1402-N4)-methyltransferase
VDHQPVLLREVLEFLAVPSVRLLLDGTVGCGGHARAFLEKNSEGRVIGIDRDKEILEEAAKALAPFAGRFELHHAAFADLEPVLDQAGHAQVDGALFDLGVSSPQLADAERGFSFRNDGPLDMRMDRSTETTAEDLVNRLPQNELGNLIFELGGERSARRVASAIVAERRKDRIRATGRLASIVRRAVRGKSRIDAATRTFQALRMAVNDEIGQLETALSAATRRLAPGGRAVVISFHSGEDRVVKRFFRESADLEVLTKKPLRATPGECSRNPRSRSARLRAAERRAPDA